jgi:hypothetical protein
VNYDLVDDLAVVTADTWETQSWYDEERTHDDVTPNHQDQTRQKEVQEA